MASRPHAAFFLASQRFHIEAVASLHGSVLDVRLVAPRPSMVEQCRRTLPGSLVYDSVVARAGEWAEVPSRGFRGVPAARLSAIGAYETAAKNMIDRWNWTGASSMAVHRLYLRYVEIWSTYLDELQPDVVLFHGEPHRGFDWVLYALCRTQGIPTPIVTFTLLDDRLAIRGAIEELPGPAPEELPVVAAGASDGPADDFQVSAPPSYYVRETIPRERDVDALYDELSFRRTALSRTALGKARQVFERYPTTFPHLVPDSPVTQLDRKVENLRVRRLIRRSLALYTSAAREPDLEGPYVYYPLHFQPEATTIPMGGPMYYELNNLRLLSSALPDGWRIVAKEHPQMVKFTKEWPRARGLLFYEELAAIPRVHLAPIEFPSEELSRRSALVATTTGSAGWEALLAGKFVLVFGYPWYGRCPGVTHVSSEPSCAAAIEAATARGLRNDERLVQAFVDEFTENHSFLGGWDDAAADHSATPRADLVRATAEGIGRWVEAEVS